MKNISIRYLTLILLVSLLVQCCFTLIIFSQSSGKINKKQMAEKVKKEFLHAWNGYKKYAWGHDALKPLSKTFHDWYPKTLLMSVVDSYDALLLMGLKNEAKEAKELIRQNLKFDVDMKVQHFEVSIRILGGLLSAYQLDGDKLFLDLATELGNRMIKVFDSKTGMPFRMVNLKTGEVSGTQSNPAEIGTYILEYGVLSKLTGNPIYYEKAKKAMVSLNNRRSKLDLPGDGINIETGEWTGTSSHISGCIDSYFEYMLKGAILFKDKELKEMWDISKKAINTYLAEETSNGIWYGHVNMDTGKITQPFYGALDAFFAAVLVLDGDLTRAIKLQESNFKMWELYGIEPETIDYRTNEVYGGYFLRPENLESAYYLYKFTKDEKYLQMGKKMFKSLVKYCRTNDGYAALKEVKTKTKDDYMESFFLAETLKYAFLLFADESVLDFEKTIFGTEAHPYKNTWDK